MVKLVRFATVLWTAFSPSRDAYRVTQTHQHKLNHDNDSSQAALEPTVVAQTALDNGPGVITVSGISAAEVPALDKLVVAKTVAPEAQGGREAHGVENVAGDSTSNVELGTEQNDDDAETEELNSWSPRRRTPAPTRGGNADHCKCRDGSSCSSDDHPYMWCYVEKVCKDSTSGDGGPWSEKPCEAAPWYHFKGTANYEVDGNFSIEILFDKWPTAARVKFTNVAPGKVRSDNCTGEYKVKGWVQGTIGVHLIPRSWIDNPCDWHMNQFGLYPNRWSGFDSFMGFRGTINGYGSDGDDRRGTLSVIRQQACPDWTKC